MNNSDEITPRKQICDELGISLSTERKMRQEEPDWPPHLLIGRKIFYRRESVRQWVARREAGAKPTVSVPTFTPQQADWLQSVFGPSNTAIKRSGAGEEVA